MDAFGIIRKRGRDGKLCKNPGYENLAEISDLIKLPSEVQLKIMEYLNPADVARVGCVCKELRIRAADEELWNKIMATDSFLTDEFNKICL
ncbi:hypothetical protein SUGI_0238620 [Cryptomeria japonica]|nr:hypothetical protein SUGI_0238620 [Cryptomeria japonica]